VPVCRCSVCVVWFLDGWLYAEGAGNLRSKLPSSTNQRAAYVCSLGFVRFEVGLFTNTRITHSGRDFGLARDMVALRMFLKSCRMCDGCMLSTECKHNRVCHQLDFLRSAELMKEELNLGAITNTAIHKMLNADVSHELTSTC
jgi:hypothetical protein